MKSQHARLTLIGGLFNCEQSTEMLPLDGVLIKHATCVRRDQAGQERAPVTYVEQRYELLEVAPGCWVGLHDSLRKDAA